MLVRHRLKRPGIGPRIARSSCEFTTPQVDRPPRFLRRPSQHPEVARFSGPISGQSGQSPGRSPAATSHGRRHQIGRDAPPIAGPTWPTEFRQSRIARCWSRAGDHPLSWRPPGDRLMFARRPSFRLLLVFTGTVVLLYLAVRFAVPGLTAGVGRTVSAPVNVDNPIPSATGPGRVITPIRVFGHVLGLPFFPGHCRRTTLMMRSLSSHPLTRRSFSDFWVLADSRQRPCSCAGGRRTQASESCFSSSGGFSHPISLSQSARFSARPCSICRRQAPRPTDRR